LRPFEASRLAWEQVNLKDGEIRLDATQTKTKTGRTVKICPTLKAWLAAHKGKSFFPANWRKEFEAVKAAATITTWPVDVLRHTAISHYFRKTGSYGFTAEQFGNSEAIIKAHYQSRVSSEDTKAFYRIMPAKGGVK
jgi:integrase